jgi:hypothetical protein
MDRQIVITQLINAIIVIITTIVTVRVTLGRTNRSRPTIAQKLRTKAKRYGVIIVDVFLICLILFALSVILWHPDQPATKSDALSVSVLITSLVVNIRNLRFDLMDLRQTPAA